MSFMNNLIDDTEQYVSQLKCLSPLFTLRIYTHNCLFDYDELETAYQTRMSLRRATDSSSSFF